MEFMFKKKLFPIPSCCTLSKVTPWYYTTHSALNMACQVLILNSLPSYLTGPVGGATC